jgi:hypothetical protein
MTNEQIKETLAQHKIWLHSGHTKGNRADLTGAYLKGANLYGADLRGANLNGTHLSGADLRGANLNGTHLSGADLTGAYLIGANLTGADLARADLTGANLTLEYSKVWSLYKCKVSKEHLPWLTGRSDFGELLSTLIVVDLV